MACSKPTSDDLDSDENSLIICSICLDEMKSPKALPCLHSVCLECLKKVGHPPGRFICPLCQEEIPLPPDGVDGFRDNFLINQLKEREAIYRIGDIKKTCACCKSSDMEILAQCMDCNGFICHQCVTMHQSLEPLRPHSVFTIEELKSRKVEPSKLVRKQYCKKHEDQVLRWFCKTCGIPICRDCTVMEHTRPDHDYDTIESVTEGQLAEIKKLMANCRGISTKIDEAMEKTKQVKDNLAKSADEAQRQLDEAKEEKQRTLLKALEEKYEANTKKLVEIMKKQNETIDNSTLSRQNLQSKLNMATKIADQVIKTGSKHDIVSNYSKLRKTLTQLQNVEPTGVSKGLGEVKFRPCQKVGAESGDLGTISSKPNPADGYGKWVLEKEIGKCGPGRIQNDFGVAVHPNTSDIYIADYDAKNIKVFDSQGKYKQVIQGNLKEPHDIAISSNGFHFITDRSAYVKVFNPDGIYLKQFPVISPDGTSSDSDGSTLYTITIDTEGNFLVGNYNKSHISKHKQDGTHILSSKIGIKPWFITSIQQDKIAVGSSNYRKSGIVHILDCAGKLQHTFNLPQDSNRWRPCSVCCSDDGILYVTSYDGGGGIPTGIYSFTENGEYLGCVTTDVTHAQGIALLENDRLVAVQWNGLPAKIFSYVV